MNERTLRVLLRGGLGDALITTPVFKAIKEKYPDRRIVIHCFSKSQQVIFNNNPHVDRVTDISFIRNPVSYIQFYFKTVPVVNHHYAALLPTIFYHENAKDIIAGMYGIELKDKKVQLFLSEKEEKTAKAFMSRYQNPILIHVTSKTSKNQEWDHDNWRQLIEEMPGYTFIQLGIENEVKVENALDMRGKLSFRETLGIIKYAKSFVGVNSSFAHATNAFDIPGVVIFGPSRPDIWGHPNNINLYKPVRCSPCLDLLQTCPCPYDKLCMNKITVADVRTSLLRQLQHGN